MSEEVLLNALSSGNDGVAYTDDNGTSTMVNPPPRLGRSKIFAREELMYANSQPAQRPHQFRTNANPAFRGPLQKKTATRGSNPAEKTMIQERPDNLQRRSKAAGSRRVSTKDPVDVEDENPLQRYENALLRYRKSAQGGVGGLRKERKEPQYNFGNNEYSSSDDSEGATTRNNKSKSTSSIDTQSVNNILDEYEDLDYGRSSDLSDSGSISVSNFEAVMDQRKRHQQQQQHNQVERSSETVEKEDCKEREGKPNQDRCGKSTSERPDPVFKVNQQTQVRQRSRDRQSTIANSITSTREASNKLNSSGEDQTRSRQDASSGTTSENRSVAENRVTIKQVPEVLLRKGEVQKRVDEWLNQTQAQNFSALNSGKRESSRIVALVRSSSSAESKNLRRCRNDARSRSTDENSGDRLNGTASYDDINRTELAKNERKLERTKNVAVVSATRGTYKDYLAGKNRSRNPTDYGFVGHGSSVRTGESISGGSRIPQRGPVNSRRREASNDYNAVDFRTTTSETASVTVTVAPVTTKQEKNLSRSSRLIAAEARNISGGFVKTRTETVSCNGAITASTAILANGRAASFKRARSHERNIAIASGRNTGALVKEEQQSTTGNSRIRGGSLQHHQLVSKGQLGGIDQQQKQQNSVTSPNKVGESRRLLVASREPRVHEDLIEQACKPVDESIKQQQQQQQFLQTTEKKEDVVETRKEEMNLAKYIGNASCETSQSGREVFLESSGTPMIEGSSNSAVSLALRSPDESRTPRSRLIRENSDVIEPRKPPAPPRRDQSRRDKTESTSINECQSTDQPCSSFRPTKRMYSALRQTNEQNSFATGVDTRGLSCDLSSVKSHYAAPKQVEKIYERSLQPQVIHSNDLESILKPVVRASAYGESAETESTRIVKDTSNLSDKTTVNEIADVFLDKMEIDEENRTSECSRIARYPEIGLDQCLKIQRRHPSTRSPSKEISVENRGLPTIHTKCWDQEIIIEPTKTFGTFQPANTLQCFSNSGEQTEKNDTFRKNEDIIENTIVDLIKQPTCQEPDLIPKLKVSIASSYEARSTLRLDRNFVGGISKDPDHQKNNQDAIHCDDIGTKNVPVVPEFKVSDVEEKRSIVQDNSGGEHGAVVNEVLVKNLRFQQDLPKSDSPLRIIGPIIAPKPFNFNSVLSDDYEKIQADDCAAKHDKECKIYVTKDEMERQRLMDLLKRGDFESIKSVSTLRIQ